MVDENNQPLFENDIVEFTAQDGTIYKYQILLAQENLGALLLDLDSQKAEYFETDDFSEMRLIGTKMRNEL